MRVISGYQMIILVGLFLFALLQVFTSTPKVVKDLQSGKKTLECNFNDGDRIVPADKIVGVDDVHMRWLFSNGSAAMRNCEIY